MILNDITAIAPKKQVRKVFEQFFNSTLPVDQMNKWQTRRLLSRVRTALSEHRTRPDFHKSERDPAYLKMLMMEQALTDHLKSGAIPEPRRIYESEVQQAQVVLAAKDMIDSIQKMIEDVSEMQFKELPALVDSIRNQVGTAEADQFNQAAGAALSGMVQNLQGSKTQLEQAQGVLTGQGPVGGTAPDLGAAGAMPGAEGGMAAMPPPPGGDIEADLSLDANLPEPDSGGGAALGRKRR